MRSKHLAGILFAGMALPLSAQDTFRAEIRSNYSSNGKCTIEVEVDGVADVEIIGDRGRIRTLEGQRASWRRMICSQPLPRNPIDFKFRGIDGRGRQNLVQDPRSSGAAVVRIEDSKGGREGYTFDLEWKGGTYDNNTTGWGRDDDIRNRNNRRDDNNPNRNNRRDDNWNRGNRDSGWGNNSGGTWNNRNVDFRGSGNGFIRSGSRNDRIRGLDLEIRDNGRVRAQFATERGDRLNMTGRVTRVDGNRVYADMSGNGLDGNMAISMDGDRVRNLSMTGAGRDRFQLQWSD